MHWYVIQAGALDKTFSLLFCGGPDNMPPPPASDVTYAASCKLACWLLANLTASFGSPARQMILARQSVVERVVHLASPGASQGALTSPGGCHCPHGMTKPSAAIAMSLLMYACDLSAQDDRQASHARPAKMVIEQANTTAIGCEAVLCTFPHACWRDHATDGLSYALLPPHSQAL